MKTKVDIVCNASKYANKYMHYQLKEFTLKKQHRALHQEKQKMKKGAVKIMIP